MISSWGTSKYVSPGATMDPALKANVSAIGSALSNNGATLPTYAQSQGIGQTSPIYAGVNAAQAAQPAPIPPVANPNHIGSQENYQASYPGGVQNPILDAFTKAGFSQGDLYRNVGNNTGLEQALLGREGWDQNRALTNQYNTGSGLSSQADFWNNLNKSQGAGELLSQAFGGPSKIAGITPIAEMQRLGLIPMKLPGQS